LRGRLARRVRETVRGDGLAGRPVPRPGPTSHLAGACDTLVADADGIYHPGLFNDRLILGLKGIMSEAELHVLRARLDGGIRSKAARGHLRRGLPVGLVWGEAGGQIGFRPDEAVTGVIGAVSEQFAVCGSARGVWLRLRDQGLRWPLQGAYRRGQDAEITWAAAAASTLDVYREVAERRRRRRRA
jgi:DNA invertase Pin-like site-specific DNA recombinase